LNKFVDSANSVCLAAGRFKQNGQDAQDEKKPFNRDGGIKGIL
jgi:hypothetical protein